MYSLKSRLNDSGITLTFPAFPTKEKVRKITADMLECNDAQKGPNLRFNLPDRVSIVARSDLDITLGYAKADVKCHGCRVQGLARVSGVAMNLTYSRYHLIQDAAAACCPPGH